MKHCTLANPFNSELLDMAYRAMNVDFDVVPTKGKVRFMGQKHDYSDFWSFGVKDGILVSALFEPNLEKVDFRALLSVSIPEMVNWVCGAHDLSILHRFLVKALDKAEFSLQEVDDNMTALEESKFDGVFYLLRSVDLAECRRQVKSIAGLLFLSTFIYPELFVLAEMYALYACGILVDKRLTDILSGKTEMPTLYPRFKNIRFSVENTSERADTEGALYYNIMDATGASLLCLHKIWADFTSHYCDKCVNSIFLQNFDKLYKGTLGTCHASLYHDPTSSHFGVSIDRHNLAINLYWARTWARSEDEFKLSVPEICGLTAYAQQLVDVGTSNNPLFQLDLGKDEFYTTDRVVYADTCLLCDTYGIFCNSAVTGREEKSRVEEDSSLHKEVVSLRSEVRKLREDNELLRLSLSSQDSKATDTIKDLNYQLDLKKETIRKLELRLSAIENEVQGYYGDETFDELPEVIQCMELDKMIEFINEFRVAIVGGFSSKFQELGERGLTNITFISENGDLRGTASDFDFVVICTKFVSHKLVYKIKAVYTDPDMILYFNGINVDKFIAICYDFIVSKLGGHDNE